MFKKIELALQEYEKDMQLLKEEIARASGNELKNLAQQIEDYDKKFLLQLQLYIKDSYKTVGAMIKDSDDQKIQRIKKLLIDKV